jgi:hypothetical protein
MQEKPQRFLMAGRIYKEPDKTINKASISNSELLHQSEGQSEEKDG